MSPTETRTSASAGNDSAHSNTPALTTSQRKRIRGLLKVAKRDPRHSQIDLQSYLLLPIQRIPRYKMLFEALVGCTPCDVEREQSDPLLLLALEAISQLASEMNEKKRESEGRQRLLLWHARLGAEFRSPLVQPHRMLLKEGVILLIRVVKRTTQIAANSLSSEGNKTSFSQIESLGIDTTPKLLVSVGPVPQMASLNIYAADLHPVQRCFDSHTYVIGVFRWSNPAMDRASTGKGIRRP